MEKTVEIPGDIEVAIQGGTVTMKSQGKELERKFKDRKMAIEKTGNVVTIRSLKQRKDNLAVVNSLASHLRNMVTGLKQGYEYKLEVVYSHFPISVSVKEGFVEITNLAGQKSPIKSKIEGNATVESKGKDITIKSIDKEWAGQTAANLERATKIRGRDRRVFQDGIYIVSKPKTTMEKVEENDGKEEGNK